MKELNELVEAAAAAKEFKRDIGVKPETILAIAEAFRALEQRAEAAEEWVKTAERTMDYQAGVITELGVRAEAAEAALERESDIHIDTAAAMREWRVRAEAAEAKLAELEKQKPSCSHHWIRSEGRTASGWLCSKCGDYDGPTPAADLTELVPDERSYKDIDCQLTDFGKAISAQGWNDCRAAILRKIEEAK